MSLLPVIGHEDLRRRLRTAAGGGRLPQSVLFHGPPGIGKERLALWLAGLVLCDDAQDPPCGRCRSCRLADGLQHPDIHWFFPLPSPKGASTPAKRRQKLEEARLEELAARRESPLWPGEPHPAAAIFLPIVQTMRAIAVRRPAMGGSAVFVVGDAERMVPQPSSPEAANAFLKLLEEPPPDTLLFLTSSRPSALLPTVRSRVLAVRMTSPPEAATAGFLEEHAGADAVTAARLARLTQGSIGRAVAMLRRSNEDPREEAVRLLSAAMAGSREDRMRLAASFPSSGARGTFSTVLDALGEVLRDAVGLAAGAKDAAFDPELARRLPGVEKAEPARLLRALEHVEEARAAAAGNGNPQAITAVLLVGMATELRASTYSGADGPVPREASTR